MKSSLFREQRRSRFARIAIVCVLLALLIQSILQYLKENLGAAKVHLTTEEISEIREIANVANANSVGDRYPSDSMQFTLVDTPPL